MFSMLFVFGWPDVAEALVEAGVVELAEVFDDRELELRAAAPDTVGDQLGRERVDEGLGELVENLGRGRPTATRKTY
jgi:hypothetical protein